MKKIGFLRNLNCKVEKRDLENGGKDTLRYFYHQDFHGE